MKLFGDYHMHSTYSDGRADVEEMVDAAAKCGLREMGITDHGPANIGTGVKSEEVFLEIKKELRALQPNYPELKIFVGAEADIISSDGDLDISRKIIAQLDYLLVGLHPYVRPQKLSEAGWVLKNQVLSIFPSLRSQVINSNTKALVESIYKYDIKAITHPGLKMPVDISEAARACVKRDTAWEINTGHEFPGYREILEAARFGVDFIVNSDAHFSKTVGHFEYGIKVLEKAGITSERVRNAISEE